MASNHGPEGNSLSNLAAKGVCLLHDNCDNNMLTTTIDIILHPKAESPTRNLCRKRRCQTTKGFHTNHHPRSNHPQSSHAITTLPIQCRQWETVSSLQDVLRYELTPHRTDWHLTHLGGIIQRGPGLICVEATAVQANGRITPEDSGLWEDSQIEPLRRIVEFAHSQGVKIMIQLGHAGRKGSTVAPWISGRSTSTAELGGWPEDVVAPSAIPYSDTFPNPRAMSKDEIETFKADFVASVKRAITAGFDAIEIHNAHGYLLHEFISPASNQRTDEYGGSFENRTRLTLETVDLVRQTIPKDMPLFLRISATDWLEDNPKFKDPESSWTTDQTIRLAKILAERGVDVLDVSSGGNHFEQNIKSGLQKKEHGDAYQSSFSFQIKEAVGDKLLVSSVGSINTGPVAEKLLQDGLDLVVVGRWLQKNPGLLFTWADELKVKVRMPNQISWAFGGRG